MLTLLTVQKSESTSRMSSGVIEDESDNFCMFDCDLSWRQQRNPSGFDIAHVAILLAG